MSAKPKATAVQAKILAKLFGGQHLQIGDRYRLPSEVVLIRNGWVSASDETGTFPNGDKYVVYKISDSGEDELEVHLFDRRVARTKLPPER